MNSGGQRQRVGIARAPALKPNACPATTYFSPSTYPVQVQIVNMLKRLQQELGLAYLLCFS